MIRFTTLIKTLSTLQRTPLKKVSYPVVSPVFKPYFNFTSSANPNTNRPYQSPNFLLSDEQSFHIADYESMLKEFSSSKDMPKDDALNKIRVLYKLAYVNYKRNDVTEALNYYSEAVTLANHLHITNTVELGCIYNGIASVCLAQNDLEGALKELEKASEVFAKLGSTEEIKSQIVKNTYLKGIAYERLGELDKGVQYLTEALNKANALTNKDDKSANTLILIYDLLGFAHQKKKDIANAADSWKKGLDIATKRYGKASNEAKVFYENLAWSEFYEQNYNEALKYAESCLNTGVESKDGDYREHSCVNLIGNIYLKKEDYGKAIEYYNKAINLIEKSPEKDYEKLGNIYMLLSESHFLNHDDKNLAMDAFTKAIKAFTEAFGADNTRIAEGYEAWGTLLKKNIMKISQAKEAYLKALEIYRKGDMKKAAPKLLEIYSYLGELAYYDENYEQAEKYFKECIHLPSDQIRKLPQMEEVYSFLGTIYNAQGKYQESIEYYKKTIEFSSDLDKNNANLDFHWRNLAAAYEKADQLPGAEETYRKALEFAMSRYGKEDETTQRVVQHLLDVLKKLDKVAEYKSIKERYAIQNS